MGKILTFLTELVSRPNDAKRHQDGIEYPDQTVREVPVKLLNKHQDMQAYIRAYVQSEVRLAELKGEHETIEDALDFEVDDPAFQADVTAAQLEAEELAELAQQDFSLRRIRKLVDTDNEMKAAHAAAAAAANNGSAPVVPPVPLTEVSPP